MHLAPLINDNHVLRELEWNYIVNSIFISVIPAIVMIRAIFLSSNFNADLAFVELHHIYAEVRDWNNPCDLISNKLGVGCKINT